MITPPFLETDLVYRTISRHFIHACVFDPQMAHGQIRRKERAKTHIEKLKAEEYKNQYELEQITHYFSSSLADKEES